MKAILDARKQHTPAPNRTEFGKLYKVCGFPWTAERKDHSGGQWPQDFLVPSFDFLTVYIFDGATENRVYNRIVFRPYKR